MAEHIDTGKLAEDLAAKHLQAKGYKILHRNWRSQHKEIDIIAQQADLLIVVEVKSRTAGAVDKPESAVNRKKQRNIIAATQKYIEKYEIDLETRFDIISIYFYNENFKLQHIEDAFAPQW